MPKTRLLLAGIAAALALGGCGKYEPKPEAAPTKPLQPPAASSVVAEPKPAGPNLDGYGNLRGTKERVLGFEIPMGARKTGKGESRFVSANTERFVRFFRSRGYRIESLKSGAHKITHTRRTLDQLSVDTAKPLETAQVFVDPGPGPGFTMMFNAGVPQVKPDLLTELREAERQFDPAFKKAQAKYRAGLEAAQNKKRASPAATKPGATAPTATSGKSVAGSGFGGAKSGTRRVYTPEDLNALRRKAAKRLKNPRVRKMQQKIRDWERKTGQTFYH